jgi:heme/copper-type cytochrome/quinol oxidase subunit 3
MKHRRKSTVLGIVFAAAFAVAFIAMIGQAWKEISEGHGAEKSAISNGFSGTG